MHSPSQQKRVLPNPLKDGRSLPSTGVNWEAKQASYEAVLQCEKWKQVSPSYVRTLTGRLSHWLQMKSHPPKNQKWQVIKLIDRVYSKAKAIIWTISCPAPMRSIYMYVISYQEDNYMKACNLLISNKKSQHQNSSKAKDFLQWLSQHHPKIQQLLWQAEL